MQYATLAETQRDGVLIFRAQMVAAGDAELRESETLPNAAAIERILLNCGLSELGRDIGNASADLKSSIVEMGAILSRSRGFEQRPSFDALSPLVDRMTAFIQARSRGAIRACCAVAPVDEAKAVADAAAAPAATSEFASLAEVDAALAARARLFREIEPSSAAVLLIGQARQLLGKNLYEVMKVLAPTTPTTLASSSAPRPRSPSRSAASRPTGPGEAPDDERSRRRPLRARRR